MLSFFLFVSAFFFLNFCRRQIFTVFYKTGERYIELIRASFFFFFVSVFRISFPAPAFLSFDTSLFFYPTTFPYVRTFPVVPFTIGTRRYPRQSYPESVTPKVTSGTCDARRREICELLRSHVSRISPRESFFPEVRPFFLSFLFFSFFFTTLREICPPRRSILVTFIFLFFFFSFRATSTAFFLFPRKGKRFKIDEADPKMFVSFVIYVSRPRSR